MSISEKKVKAVIPFILPSDYEHSVALQTSKTKTIFLVVALRATHMNLLHSQVFITIHTQVIFIFLHSFKLVPASINVETAILHV